MHRTIRCALAVLLIAAPGSLAAQDLVCERGDLEVRTLRFEGNRAFRGSDLANRIATTPSSLWRRTFRALGKKWCLDSQAVTLDSVRLWRLYVNHGYWSVRVLPSIRSVSSSAVSVTFRLVEGEPIRVDSLAIFGLAEVRDSARVLRKLPISRGSLFDRALVDATRDSLVRRLRNDGYAFAEALRSFEVPDTAVRKAILEYSVIPGRRATIGVVNVSVDVAQGAGPHVTPGRVRRVLGVRQGAVYREEALERAKRGLYLTDAFQHVDITLDSLSEADAADSSVSISVTAREGPLQSSRISAGWGQLDCGRTQGQFTHLNFLGRLFRLDVNARLSKIGIGAPFDFASALCTGNAKRDLTGNVLNYYFGATVAQAALYRLRYVPSVTVYSERRSEYNAFRRTAPVGALASAYREGNGLWPMTLTYQLEYGKTEAQPAFFCGVFRVCEAEARDQLEQLNRLAVLGWATVRNRTNDRVNPSDGSMFSVEARHASPMVGSDARLQFNRLLADYAVYRRVSDAGVFVMRLRAGTVIGRGITLSTGKTTFVPPQERMYAGGPTTVRGFSQNELGQAIYTQNDLRAITIDTLAADAQLWAARPAAGGEQAQALGGDNVVIANAELRLRSPVLAEFVQYALFVDAGEVWNRKSLDGVGFEKLRVTPGLGIRVFSPVGPIRVDVGYNPYQRPPGAIYFSPNPSEYSPGQQVQLICVTPGNGLLVHPARTEGNIRYAPQQQEGKCAPTYVPQGRATLLRRLTFNFSIGQPF